MSYTRGQKYQIGALTFYLISGSIQDYSTLQIFHIYFDTSTYDEVGKDVKVTMEGMLGVVGGTMGLLTG